MIRRGACLLVAACLLAAVLPAEEAEATVEVAAVFPNTNPLEIIEQELERELQAAAARIQELLDSLRDLPGQVWRYCAPDFSGTEDVEEAQALLDCLGLIPYVGIGFDTANAIWSAAQGNWEDAAIRAVFIIPIVGNVVGLKIVVKARRGTTISVDTLENLKKSLPNTRPWRLPAKSDTVSVFENVQRPSGTASRGSTRHLSKSLKQEAGIPAEEWDRWTLDHTLPLSLKGTNTSKNLKVLTYDANQVKSRVESAVAAFKDKHKDRVVVDFVVDHGITARRPDRTVVKIAVDGKGPITVTIPNVHGAGAVSTLRVDGVVSINSEAWRLAGAIGNALQGSGSSDSTGSHDSAGSHSAGSHNTGQANGATVEIVPADAGDRCVGCRWMTGSGSGWAPGERFHIRCSGGGRAFVDTSTGLGAPNGYRARYATPAGEIRWERQICFSAYSETEVEVWNASGQRVVVIVRSDSTGSHNSAGLHNTGQANGATVEIVPADAGDRCVGCRWMTGSGSGWAPGERFHIRCSGGGRAFVDTSTGLGAPNGYRARYATPAGEIRWERQICFSAYSETEVEVWNASGQRVVVTVR